MSIYGVGLATLAKIPKNPASGRSPNLGKQPRAAPRLHFPLHNPVALAHQPTGGSLHDPATQCNSEACKRVRMLNSCTGQLVAQSFVRRAIVSAVLVIIGPNRPHSHYQNRQGGQFWQFIPGQTSAAAAAYSRGNFRWASPSR